MRAAISSQVVSPHAGSSHVASSHVATSPATLSPATSSPTVIKSPKAASAAVCSMLEQLPNIGPSLAADLRSIGIERPIDLRGKDAFVLYQKLCALTAQRHDPCVLDTFMAAVDFMGGAPAAPWWHYTPQRKALFGPI